MDIKKVIVLGAGTIGYQIAQLCAQAGNEVILRDIDDDLVQKGLKKIKDGIQRFYVDKGKISQEEGDRIIGRLRGATEMSEARDCDLVIEAIPEIMDLKKQVFKDLDGICKPGTIFGTNTSGLRIRDIGSLTNRQDKVIGLHFFNPVQLMKLVEVVKTDQTSQETIDICLDYVKKLGKEPVVVKDSPGFVSTRLFMVFVNEAAIMVDEGLASPADIDKIVRLGLNHPMGPLEIADLSIDTALNVLNYFQEEMGDKYEPASILRECVKEGRLGIKTGSGFYDYSKKKLA